MPYSFWSNHLNVHFGYYRWGINPFNREAMLRGMNDLVGKLLSTSTPPDRILDIGCGFGSTAFQIHRFFPSSNFVGVNNNETQVAFANAKSNELGLRNLVEFRTLDFTAMPFSKASFDAAYAIESTCYAEGNDKKKLLLEIARVLRPNGRFVAVDGFRRHGNQLPKLVEWLYNKNLDAWEIPRLAQIWKFKEALQEVGFEDIQERDISWNMLPSLAHIPFVVLKLFFSNLFYPNFRKQWYMRALLMTLALAPFKRHFGYFLVTCVKGNVEFEK